MAEEKKPETLEEKIARLKAEKNKKQLERLQKVEKRARDAKNFHNDFPHKAYVSPNAFRRKVNAYFELRELDHRPQTVPGFALFIGCRTQSLKDYDPGPRFVDYQKIVQYAIQRIEMHLADKLVTDKGAAKGLDVLMQNTLGYANRSDVNSKQSIELTEREKLRSLSDGELTDQLEQTKEKIDNLLNFPVKVDKAM
jgi:hypothetical protein